MNITVVILSQDLVLGLEILIFLKDVLAYLYVLRALNL